MQRTTQDVALDSCVVIDLLRKKSIADKLRNSFKGKPIRIILCDVVLREVKKITGLGTGHVASRVSRLVGKKVEISTVDGVQRVVANCITSQYPECHRGDNFILALCQTKAYVLITFDRVLLRTCDFVGVPAFRPNRAGGI